MRRKIFFVLMIIWMAVIFMFSARDANESTKDSNTIGLMICKVVYSDFDSWPEYKQLEYAKKIDHPVRKSGHVSEYIVLSILVLGAIIPEFKSFKVTNSSFIGLISAKAKYRFYVYWIVGIIISILYAATDEFHQYFVPGRSAEFKDVMIDSIGVVIGGVIVGIVYLVRQRKNVR